MVSKCCTVNMSDLCSVVTLPIRCKLFYKKESEFKEKGVGTLHLKMVAEGKLQLLIRADTNLGKDTLTHTHTLIPVVHLVCVTVSLETHTHTYTQGYLSTFPVGGMVRLM